MARIAKAYRINLVRVLRERERQQEQRRRYQMIAGVGCFAFLVMAFLYSGLTMWNMELILASEKNKLEHIQNEYRKYTATRMTVDKNDVELLNSLHGRGIFWTKKLAAMATHLPDNYAITSFSFRGGELRVAGTGYASPKQDQLLVLDGYMKNLRSDSTFSDVFKQIYLNRAEREKEGAGKIEFEFSALTAQATRN
jgi:Tfp pilus assembly protein PilN